VQSIGRQGDESTTCSYQRIGACGREPSPPSENEHDCCRIYLSTDEEEAPRAGRRLLKYTFRAGRNEPRCHGFSSVPTLSWLLVAAWRCNTGISCKGWCRCTRLLSNSYCGGIAGTVIVVAAEVGESALGLTDADSGHRRPCQKLSARLWPCQMAQEDMGYGDLLSMCHYLYRCHRWPCRLIHL
jgi:hypothetical protein